MAMPCWGAVDWSESRAAGRHGGLLWALGSPCAVSLSIASAVACPRALPAPQAMLGRAPTDSSSVASQCPRLCRASLSWRGWGSPLLGIVPRQRVVHSDSHAKARCRLWSTTRYTSRQVCGGRGACLDLCTPHKVVAPPYGAVLPISHHQSGLCGHSGEAVKRAAFVPSTIHLPRRWRLAAQSRAPIVMRSRLGRRPCLCCSSPVAAASAATAV